MKFSHTQFSAMKGTTPIAMLTAYTAPIASAVEAAGIPIILVGDTLAMVEMGFDSTREITIDHMEYHVGAVRRGAPNTHIIGDLPYQADKDPQTALINAQRLIASGADSIKLEGAKCDVIKHLVSRSIPVIGHTGLLPQTAANFKKVGVSQEQKNQLFQDAKNIQDAGAYMLVLEHIDYQLAEELTKSLAIPTIGIGAGPHCDGQVLVINDALGLGGYWPPFSKQYAHMNKEVQRVSAEFKHEVESKQFPNNIIQLRASNSD